MGFFDFSSLVKSTEQAALQISSIDAAEQLAKEQAAKEVADAAQATADKAAQEKYEKDNSDEMQASLKSCKYHISMLKKL